MKQKSKTQIVKLSTLLILVTLALVACDTPMPQPQPAAATATPGNTQAEPPAPAAPVQEPGTPTSMQVTSYRELTTMREGGRETAVTLELVAEWNALAPAGRLQRAEGGVTTEHVLVNGQHWMRTTGATETPWQAEALTSVAWSEWMDTFTAAKFWGDPTTESLPEDINIAPGQLFPNVIKAAMQEVGTEVVNDVPCRKYTVDTNFSYSEDVPDVGLTQYSGQARGELWVADYPGLPPILIRAWMDQALTTTNAQGERTTTPYWEHNIYDINTPISIQPPQ